MINCIETTISACEAAGGFFLGTALECGIEFVCPPDHSPPGACCLPAGGCLPLPPELCEVCLTVQCP
jgi:hypothetical protein